MTPVVRMALIGFLGLAIGLIITWFFEINPLIGFLLVVVGAIAGFLGEWVIDESVRKNRELQRQLDEQKHQPIPAQAAETSHSNGSELRNVEMLAEVLQQHNNELHQLSQQIATKDTEIETMRHKFDAYQKSHPDELKHLKGIGPVFQRKLRDAGFSSFEQLATANPAQIRRMLGIKNWQRVDVESWIQQARDWAEHS